MKNTFKVIRETWYSSGVEAELEGIKICCQLNDQDKTLENEKKIVRRLIRTIKASGGHYSLSNETTERKAMETITGDSQPLYVYLGGNPVDKLQRGYVSLIYGNGNDGWDLISDHTENLTELLAPVMVWIDEQQ